MRIEFGLYNTKYLFFKDVVNFTSKRIIFRIFLEVCFKNSITYYRDASIKSPPSFKRPPRINVSPFFQYFLINAPLEYTPPTRGAVIRCGLSLTVDGTEDDLISIPSIQYHRGR